MPGVFQLSPDEAAREAEKAHAHGVPAILLFGIPDAKDDKASGAFARNGIVQQTVRLLKKELPGLIVMTDVCLCEYMSHGHCGIVQKDHGGGVANDLTLPLLARAALSHAEAGADVVAPSDMMDGRVAAIRRELDRHGFSATPILSYAAKFASAYYGPFREAAESAPKFGDRRSYQMDGANAREGLRESGDGHPGGRGHGNGQTRAGVLGCAVPGESRIRLSDRRLRRKRRVPMLKAAAARGWIDERAVTLETLLAMRRAGADFIITYAAADAARWLKES